MDRNPNDSFGTGAGQGGTSGSGVGSTGGASDTAASSSASEGFGGTGAPGGAQLGSAGETGSLGSTGTATAGGSVRESARGKFGQAREKAAEVKATLADKLEAGAQKLQQRSAGSATLAETTADGTTATTVTQQDAMAKASEKVATGMRSTADWLRNNDLDTMRQGIEKEVRTNPGRSLLVAAVAGYLLGKAFRR